MFASIGLKVALALGLAGAVAGGWFYVQSLRSDLEAQQAQTARAMDVVNQQAATLDQLQKDIARVQTITTDLNKKMQAAEKSVRDLDTKFSQNSAGKPRDIGADAASKPDAVEKIINRASRDAIRCGELVTGAEPKPGETNSQCPELVPSTTEKKEEPVKESSSSIRGSVK
jgi:uncharacterized protein HemX